MLRNCVVFGSSSSEVFDYIFGDNPMYYPFWASGWSARGLRKLKNSTRDMEPYISYLSNLPKDTNILLHFGNVDIDFNLPHKIHQQNFYNFPKIIEEMCDGIISLREYLSNLGFYNIYAVFTAPPVILNEDYWDYPSLPAKTRGKLILDFAKKIANLMPTINCLYSLISSEDNPTCDPKFTRREPDHHLNYIKVLDIVYHHMNNIEGMLPPRLVKHSELYPHLGYAPDVILQTGKPRPRTCR